jgi:peptidoglycan/LPS O-acetylase OafA/YrhL
MHTDSQRLDYFPALTGLRGVAAGAVLLLHAWQFAGAPTDALNLGFTVYPLHAPAALGFLGVDLFFVLSGFLLAQPFLAAARGQRAAPSLQTFALRRARRVLPAFWAQLLILFAIGAALQAAPDVDLRSLLAHAFFVQELFPTLPPINPVYWTLPVEWWFYAWLPLTCALFARARWYWIAALVLCACIAFRLNAGQWFAENRTDLLFNYGAIDGLRARFDQFFLGVLAAWAHLHLARDHPLRRVALILALILIAVLAPFLVDQTTTYLYPDVPWTWFHFSVIGAIFALLAFGAAGNHALAQRLFANPPIAWLGKISYSLYLWHWPVLAGLRGLGVMDRLGAVTGTALAVLVAVLVSWASWRWIEAPFQGVGAGTRSA